MSLQIVLETVNRKTMIKVVSLMVSLATITILPVKIDVLYTIKQIKQFIVTTLNKPTDGLKQQTKLFRVLETSPV